MSVSNLFYPNDYNLNCGTMTINNDSITIVGTGRFTGTLINTIYIYDIPEGLQKASYIVETKITGIFTDATLNNQTMVQEMKSRISWTGTTSVVFGPYSNIINPSPPPDGTTILYNPGINLFTVSIVLGNINDIFNVSWEIKIVKLEI